MALWGVGSEVRQCPLPTLLSGRRQFPTSYLDARHFSSSLCPTGAFQAGTLVLELRGSESECLYVGPLKETAWDSRSFFHRLNPRWFCSQKFWRLTFLALEPWAVGPGLGLALLTPSLDGCGFSNSVVVRFPLNSISDSSE